MLALSKRVQFSSSHRLYRPDWTPERNFEVFGNCAHLHGHNYELEVTVKGNPDPETGMIINLQELGKIIKDEIVSWVDHRDFNSVIDEFKTTLPTIENIVQVFWRKLDAALPNGILYKLTLREADTSKVEMCRD